MKVTGKATIRNRFDIVCQDIVTGEEQRYQAHNIVLDQMFTRLVNFQPFFTAIHFGTGTGTLSPTRTSLFNYSGAKSATTVEQVRELPTSHWMRQIVLQPSEYVDHELTEIGVGYSTSSSSLVTHAFIEDSEGNPISIVKTDTMVVTIYATIFFELGELTSMYGGQWRWVMPLSNNDLLNYLMGGNYLTQRFRVMRAQNFLIDGTAPGSHGSSSDITVTSWIKDEGNKRATTPVMRLGISTGNAAIRGFGLGSSTENGTFRGQLPIPGVFAGHTIEGEQIGIGDGETTGFNPAWEHATITAAYIDGQLVDPADYTLALTRRNSNLAASMPVTKVRGFVDVPQEILNRLTLEGNNTEVRFYTETPGKIAGIDIGDSGLSVYKLQVRPASSALTTVYLRGSENPDFSDTVLIASVETNAYEWLEIEFTPTQYRYYTISTSSTPFYSLLQVQLLSAEDQITFHTPPPAGAVITADYHVPYIPKDTNHVLDLQCSIQWGEG